VSNKFLYLQKEISNKLAKNDDIKKASYAFMVSSVPSLYSYNFDWLGLPIIQFPQDIIALQEIIWATKPDIIIETGVARGGSIIFYASMLQLLNNDGKVIGIDIDIRNHNRKAIEEHPLSFRVNLIQGSSIDQVIVDDVKKYIKPTDKVTVILDSNHTHEHVLAELELYSPLVTKNCYLIVMDTAIEDMPNDYFHDRPWSVGNNPKTAVHEFLKTTDRFEIDESIHNKLLITVAPDGYLKCIK
jgi:cephalosporin hydroxylase